MSWIISGKEAGSLGLLDQYAGAAAAYSLRELSVYYAGPVVRVRRSSDNTEQDFTAAQITDGTLTAFCGAGDGFVRTWYDQSGNNYHAEQAVAGAQPGIVSNGSLFTVNTKPALKFDGVADELLQYYSMSRSHVFTVIQSDINQAANGMRLFSSQELSTGVNYLNISIGGAAVSDPGAIYRWSGASWVKIGQSGIVNNTQQLLEIDRSATSTSVYINSADKTVANTSIWSDNTKLSIGGRLSSGFGDRYDGALQEIVFYSTNQSTNRTGIEANINAHYAIY